LVAFLVGHRSGKRHDAEEHGCDSIGNDVT